MSKQANVSTTVKITSKEQLKALVCLIEMIVTERYQQLLESNKTQK